MSMIAPSRSIAMRSRRITLTTPSAAQPDGDGGYTQYMRALDPPQMFAHVRPASARDLEQIAGATTLPTATHLVTIPFHQQVTTETVIGVHFNPFMPPRVLKVVFVGNPDERDTTLELVCAEQVS